MLKDKWKKSAVMTIIFLMILTGVFGSYTDHLYEYWNMSTPNGYFGRNNCTAIYGNPQQISDEFGTGYELDGNDYFYCGDINEGAFQYNMSIYIFGNATSGGEHQFGVGVWNGTSTGTFFTHWHNSGAQRGGINTNSNIYTTDNSYTLTTGSMYCLGMQYDGGRIYSYVNHSSDNSSSPANGYLDNGNASFHIGIISGNQEHIGNIYEVALYNESFTYNNTIMDDLCSKWFSGETFPFLAVNDTPVVNETNTTTNVTQQDRIELTVNEIKEVLIMLAIVVLYFVMMLGAYKLKEINYPIALMVLITSLGLDAYMIYYLKSNYVDGATGNNLSFIYLLSISLLFWIFTKILIIATFKRQKKRRMVSFKRV